MSGGRCHVSCRLAYAGPTWLLGSGSSFSFVVLPWPSWLLEATVDPKRLHWLDSRIGSLPMAVLSAWPCTRGSTACRSAGRCRGRRASSRRFFPVFPLVAVDLGSICEPYLVTWIWFQFLLVVSPWPLTPARLADLLQSATSQQTASCQPNNNQQPGSQPAASQQLASQLISSPFG